MDNTFSKEEVKSRLNETLDSWGEEVRTEVLKWVCNELLEELIFRKPNSNLPDDQRILTGCDLEDSIGQLTQDEFNEIVIPIMIKFFSWAGAGISDEFTKHVTSALQSYTSK